MVLLCVTQTTNTAKKMKPLNLVIVAVIRMAELTELMLICVPLGERFEQIRFLGLDSPRCNRAIIHCLKWSRHCGATSPPYRTPLNRWTTNCKARTRATMQRLLHGLDTQVLGHVQKALPHDTIFPPITPLVLPPTLF